MVNQYKNITLFGLIILASIVNLILIDLYVLPKEKLNDIIISSSELTYTANTKFSRSQVLIGYEFFTQSGLRFSLEHNVIHEKNVYIKRTCLFNNITEVKTRTQDYSKELISDLNSICLYLYIILGISSNLSLIMLFLYKKITDNGFQNIILFNLTMLFFIFILYIYTK